MSHETNTRRLVEASQTLGAAYLAGLVPNAQCQRGSRIGPVKVEKCGYRYDLDFETLIWAKGPNYPCWKLNRRRLKCPKCGGLKVQVMWLPGVSPNARAGRQLYQCAEAAGMRS